MLPHINRTQLIHHARRLFLALGMILLIGVALRPMSPALAQLDCPMTVQVSDQGQLNAAITSYNEMTDECQFIIQFTQDITLEGPLPAISNDTSDLWLTIDGQGHTLDGNRELGSYFHIDSTQALVVMDLTITNASNSSIRAYHTDVTLIRSTMKNSANDGVYVNDGDLTIIDSSFYLNEGHGIRANLWDESNVLTVINSTSAGNGEYGIDVFDGVARLYNVTIAENDGYGIQSFYTALSAYNSIFAWNQYDCFQNGAGTTDFYNSLVLWNGDGPGACDITHGVDGNILGENPRLGILGDYGGPTWTMPLLTVTVDNVTTNSPAVDAGSNAHLTFDLDGDDYTLEFDQRGDPHDRIVNSTNTTEATVDMGAFEGLEAIECSFPYDVWNEVDLYNAILCYRISSAGGYHLINFRDDITLTKWLPVIVSAEGAGQMQIDGGGFTLDGNFVDHSGIEIYYSNVMIENLHITRMRNAAVVALEESRVELIDSLLDVSEMGVFADTSMAIIRDSAIVNNLNGVEIIGVGSDSALTIANSTISYNHSHGVISTADTLIVNSTITNNWEYGVGINYGDSEGVEYRLHNSIVAGNGFDCGYIAPDHPEFNVIEVRNSLFQDLNLDEEDSDIDPCDITDGEDGNIVGQDPILGALDKYGGSTPTIPLLSVTNSSGTITSPAVDAGDNAFLTFDLDGDDFTLQNDQRGPGYDRVVNSTGATEATVDMGAYEGVRDITCSTPIEVGGEPAWAEAAWNDAINCFNRHPDGEFIINVAGDILLEMPTVTIDNATNGVWLTVNGGGYTLDGQDLAGHRLLNIAPETEVRIGQLTITGSKTFLAEASEPFDHLSSGGGVMNAGELKLDQVTVSDNESYFGAGIFNLPDGELLLANSFILQNRAGSGEFAEGGGILNQGTMEIVMSRISGNVAGATEEGGGGGIVNYGELVIHASTISDNLVQSEGYGFGGGIANYRQLAITDSTISNNSVTAEINFEYDEGYGSGGGIFSYLRDNDDQMDVPEWVLAIINSTISGNTVTSNHGSYGGGLYIESGCCFEDDIDDVLMLHTTITNNKLVIAGYDEENAGEYDTAGSGIYLYGLEIDHFDLYLFNSILAGNVINGELGGDCFLETYDEDENDYVIEHTIFSDIEFGACGLDETGLSPDADGNLVGEDPNLEPLADNGGPTQTHALPSDSPAVDRGDNDWADEFDLEFDQRGDPYLRLYGDNVDMGAYEYQSEESTDFCPPVDGNVIANFCFEDGSAPWTFYSDGHGVYNVTPFDVFAGHGAAEIKITKPGSNVQFYQSGITLQGDTEYELTFTAKSNNGGDLSAFVHKHGANYASYGLDGHVFDLTTDWKEFSVEFTTPDFGSVDDARLRFWLAPFDAKGAVYLIDRVVLRPAGGDPLPPPPPPPPIEVPPEGHCFDPVDGNLIANPGYEDGTFGWKFFTNGSANLTAPEEPAADPYECDANARVQINASGNNVQVFQTGIELQPNTHYRLRLAARATGAEAVQLFVQRHSAPYSNYGLNGLKLELTDHWKVFVVDFTTSGFASPTSDTRLRLWLAPYDQAGAVFEFDDVVLTPVVVAPPREGGVDTTGAATQATAAPGATRADAHLISGYFIDDSHADRLGGGYVGVLDGCRNARASVSRLWPANNKLWPVSIGNIGSPQSVQITGVWQDEPVGFEPDAVIGTGGALHLRAERDSDAGADGRVYTIQFRATYADGQSCNGIVTVGVPLSNRRGVEARSGGELFTSTDK